MATVSVSRVFYCSNEVAQRPHYEANTKIYLEQARDAFKLSASKIAGIIGQIPKYSKYFGNPWDKSLSLTLSNICGSFGKSGLPVHFLINGSWLLLSPDSKLYGDFGTNWLIAVLEFLRDLTTLMLKEIVFPQLQVVNIVVDLFSRLLGFYSACEVVTAKPYPAELPENVLSYIDADTICKEKTRIKIAKIAKASLGLLNLSVKCLALYDPVFRASFILMPMVLQTTTKIAAIVVTFFERTSSINCYERQIAHELKSGRIPVKK